MKRRLSLGAVLLMCLVITTALIAPPALAAGSDEALSIKTMKISLWPEYDDPRVLVLYEGEFNAEVPFPQPVAFPVPLASEISQVCALQPPNDEHLCQLYDTLTEPENLSVAYELPIPTYYLEYYWDGLSGQTDKSMAFRYVSPYAIDSLEIDVQQPLRATGFKLDQSYVSATTDSQGMKHYKYLFTDVAPGQVINIGASYTKTDNKPSVSGGAPSGLSAGGGNNYGWVAVVGVIAVIGVGFFVLRRRPVATRGQTRRAARIEAKRAGVRAPARQPAPTPSPPVPSGGLQFCPFCGTKLAPKAVFCHACGASMNISA